MIFFQFRIFYEFFFPLLFLFLIFIIPNLNFTWIYLVLVDFLVDMTGYLTNGTWGRQTLFWPIVRHGRELISPGTGQIASAVRSKERWVLTFSLLSPSHRCAKFQNRSSLQSSTFLKNPHRYAQKCVSVVIVNSGKLTIKIKHHKLTVL